LTLISSPSLIKAQETSTNASTSATEMVIEKKANLSEHDQASASQILDNLERLAKDPTSSEEIKDQYEDVINKNRGFIAQVVSFKDGALKLNTLDQEEIFITPDKSTTIIKKGQSVTGENLDLSQWFNIDDWLVLIGVQNNEVFSPRRIIVSSESLEPEEQFVLRGQIKAFTSKKADVQIIGSDNTVETFVLEKTISLTNKDNATLTYKDLSLDASVMLVGTITNDKKSLQTLRLL
jgi:hypothetical protein